MARMSATPLLILRLSGRPANIIDFQLKGAASVSVDRDTGWLTGLTRGC